ncbi:hypothetical protein [Mongoliitalea daihaiensis]|uniref:hypothetical protein n=1 Tax=Mongoliitalea daihaiensis TaxID=2782006 RepID=UPI001F37C181|nr:hypothetical protein [Mongoliitalea daihaiensis]UJP65318.1 hypothetical protein IPZ59_01415 [Mongoliitalea daihaiensis]
MKKMKLVGVVAILFFGMVSFFWKFESLKSEGPRQELVLEEINEDYQVRVYREKFITGITHQGYAIGPQILQKSGDLGEVFGVLLDVSKVELADTDKRQYKLEINTSKPLKLVQPEIAAFVLDTMGFSVEKTERLVQTKKLNVQDWEKATQAKKEMGPGVLTYREVKNNRMELLGYSLNELKKELEDLFPATYFSVPSDQSNQPLYLTFSDIRKIDRVLEDLELQGISVEQTEEERDVWIVQKKN